MGFVSFDNTVHSVLSGGRATTSPEAPQQPFIPSTQQGSTRQRKRKFSKLSADPDVEERPRKRAKIGLTVQDGALPAVRPQALIIYV